MAGGISDLDFIIESVSLAQKKVKDIRLNIIGGGPLLEEFKKRFKDKSFINFLGYIPQEKIPEIIALSDLCLIYMSDTAGNKNRVSLKLMEYIAMKKRIVGHIVGENEKIFGDYVMESGTTGESFSLKLIEAIGTGLREPDSKNIINGYSLARMRESFIDALKTAVS